MTAQNPPLGRTNAAFAIAAAVATIFNTVLAWAKDLSPALNQAMARMTGHHWITHCLADCIVFLGVGLALRNTAAAERMDANRLVSVVIWSVILGALGLFAWFIFF
jgi:4-amino-4-deoxy-L-arabinose transferase-like glycosyltransferase